MPGLTHNRVLAIFLLGLVVLLYACAGPWQKAPALLSASRWTVAVPDGWMRLAIADYEMLSKDGSYLHYILIQERPLEKSFRFTRKKIDSGMLPHEVAETVLDDLLADPQIRNFKVLANTPAEVGGVLGFRLDYIYIDPHGLETQSVYLGALHSGALFNLRYTAARRHYFEKYLADFEMVRQSLRLK
jgi:hypothetical protein